LKYSLEDSPPHTAGEIEAPRSKLRGIFDRREQRLFLIRSLTPQQSCEECARCFGSTEKDNEIFVGLTLLGEKTPE